MSGVIQAVLNDVNTVHPFFSKINIQFLQDKISQQLSKHFIQKIIIPHFSLKRKMMEIFQQRLETIPRMNERVVMAACHEFRLDQAETTRNIRWEEQYVGTTQLVDLDAQKVQYDPQSIKLRQPGQVGGTVRFYFT